MDAETYIAAVTDWLRFWDAKVYEERIGPQPATVGQFYDRLLVSAGSGAYTVQVHYCVALTVLGSVDAPFAVHDFTRHVNAHAYATTRGTPGTGTLEVAIAGLISPLVHATAAAAATAAPNTTQSGTDRPVVVDLTTGQVHTHTGTRLGGAGLHLAANFKVRQLFRPPGEILPAPGHGGRD